MRQAWPATPWLALATVERGGPERGVFGFSGRASGGIRLGEDVKNLVGSAADEEKAVQSEGRPRAVADQPFETVTVGGLDADAGVQAEPTRVIPSEHILGLAGLQEPVASAMPQDPGTDRVLEAFEELGGEGCCFVKGEAAGLGGRILAGITFDSRSVAWRDRTRAALPPPSSSLS